MSVLVTGAAGFIGFHVSQALLERGDSVVGIDNLNDYYDPLLKQARLSILKDYENFDFIKCDIADKVAVDAVISRRDEIEKVVQLAAQAGVRYSLINPYSYMRSNLDGHLVLMEACKKLKYLKHFVYASSSSVYGANTKLPFSVEDPVNHPVSLYAATKRSMELLSESYVRMFGLPLTGLRFFTVYGPWGRPDMAAFIFTRKILSGEPIPVYNNGDMCRDFTFIKDIVSGVIQCLDMSIAKVSGKQCHRLYNLGNHQPEKLMHFIKILEDSLGKKAELDFQPMQQGDVKETYADIAVSQRDFGYNPSTSINDGISKFINWYREFYD